MNWEHNIDLNYMPLLQKVDVSLLDAVKEGAGIGDGDILLAGAGQGAEEDNLMAVAASTIKVIKHADGALSIKRIHNQTAQPQMLRDGSAVYVFAQGIATDLSARQFHYDDDEKYVKRVKGGEAGKECTYAEVKKMVSTLVLLS